MLVRFICAVSAKAMRLLQSSRQPSISRRPIVVVSLVLVLTLGVGVYLMRVADDRFRFEDYGGPQPLAEFIACTFPPGTPRSLVESVLVEEGGATRKYIPPPQFPDETLQDRRVRDKMIGHIPDHDVIIGYDYSWFSVRPMKGSSPFTATEKVTVYYKDDVLVYFSVAGTGNEPCPTHGGDDAGYIHRK